MVKSIAHPTDFSEGSARAFAHALRLALATKSTLELLHVTSDETERDWTSFPHVRPLLAAWGMLEADASPHDIQARLGIEVRKIEIRHQHPALGLFEFFLSHRPDLIVLSTHGREGPHRWLSGSVSEELASHSHVPTLFFGPNARGFVDSTTGQMWLKRILMPIAQTPSPTLALTTLNTFLASLGVASASTRYLHVGDDPLLLPGVAEVEQKRGDVVDTILAAAVEGQAELIVMPTAGRHGFLDALRGSTTEQVLRQACCPVLAVRAA